MSFCGASFLEISGLVIATFSLTLEKRFLLTEARAELFHQCQVFGVGLTGSSPPFYAGEQRIRVKKVRPSKTWTPPAKPQPKEEEEEKKREEPEKRKEVKPVPEPEPGKMCYGDPSRLTRKNFPGTSGQDLGRGEKDLPLLGICILTGEERGMSGHCQSASEGKKGKVKLRKGISPVSLLVC